MKQQSFVFATGRMDYLPGAGDRRFWPAEPPSSRPTSALASRLSRERHFPQFLRTIGYEAAQVDAVTAAICDYCEVDTRADLDRDPRAAARFGDLADQYAAYVRRIS